MIKHQCSRQPNVWTKVPTSSSFSSIFLNVCFLILFKSIDTIDKNIREFSNLDLTFSTGWSLFLLFTGVSQISILCWADALLMLCTLVNQIFMQHMNEIYLHFTADDWVSSIQFPPWMESLPNTFNYSCPNLQILQGILIWRCC